VGVFANTRLAAKLYFLLQIQKDIVIQRKLKLWGVG
jgi:hypothetical protein